jgi:hypothetical protein
LNRPQKGSPTLPVPKGKRGKKSGFLRTNQYLFLDDSFKDENRSEQALRAAQGIV